MANKPPENNRQPLDPRPVLVKIDHISYTHWNHTEPTLLDLSLEIRRGTLNVLVGPSGSGKTTLCDVMNGKVPHLLEGKLEGDVWVDQVNTRSVEVKELSRKVGQVFQDPESMFAMLYVDDEIAFGPENLRLPAGEIQQLTQDLLKLSGLEAHSKKLVWQLSGGQVQKLGIASVLAMQPDLLILDEPTSNLDPAATRSVHELLLSLRDQGKTILLVTRELDDFLARADQLIVLDQGRLVAAGSPQEVLKHQGERLPALGIWLPETVEIGLALHYQARRALTSDIPITVPETLRVLCEPGLLDHGLKGEPLADQATPPGEVIISARDLRFSYNSEVQALKGVSLDVRAGEMLAIVGRNGAGKSTLARLMVGLLKPERGELTMFGKPANRWKIQDLASCISLVFQNPEHQFLTDTVAGEIEYSLLARGLTNAKRKQEILQETLDMLGLTRYADLHPFSLSAGMKRRLGVATMLVGNPQALLVDEPTYGQDRQMTETLMSIMENIRSKGIAVVMITHDMRLVQEYAERVVVMSEGKVLYDGTPGRLFDSPQVLAAANLRPTLLDELLQELIRSGIPIHGKIHSTGGFMRALGLDSHQEVAHGLR